MYEVLRYTKAFHTSPYCTLEYSTPATFPLTPPLSYCSLSVSWVILLCDDLGDEFRAVVKYFRCVYISWGLAGRRWR